MFISAVMNATGSTSLTSDDAVAVLRAVAEPTRLRILALLANAELSVKDLTVVLGQSQPRISRHLKLLADAGLISRFKEGAWVNLRLSDPAATGGIVPAILQSIDERDTTVMRDRERASALLDQRTQAAEAYFAKHAADWDQIRALHVDEERVEAGMRAMLGDGPFATFVDIGTGTGRILELFADRYTKGLGVDTNQAMLAYARSRLENAGLSHAQVRHGDLYNLPLDNGSCDAIVVHQVLHFLTSPAAALAEFARVLAPHGRLLLVDFAPHDLAFLREQHAHRLLGVSMDDLDGWMRQTDLVLTGRKSFAPSEPSTEHLTVNLWLIQTQQATASRLRVRRGNLEITS
jgi:ubiquinone/menaquinone biosynthesis C-methylase UbiE/DNA-binding transcriptional ArsR family regulator